MQVMASSPLLSARNLSPIVWIVVVCYATNSIDSTEKIKNSYNTKHQPVPDSISNHHEHHFKMSHGPLTHMVLHRHHSVSPEQTDCPDENTEFGRGDHDFGDQMQSMLEHISDFLDQMMHQHSRETYFMQDDHHFHQQQQGDADCPMEEDQHQKPDLYDGFSSFDVPKMEDYSVKEPIKQSHAIQVLTDGRRLNERYKHLDKFYHKPRLTNQVTEKTHTELRSNQEPTITKQSQPISQVPVLDTTPTRDSNELDQQLSAYASNGIDVEGLRMDGHPTGTEVDKKSIDGKIGILSSAFAVEHKYSSKG